MDEQESEWKKAIFVVEYNVNEGRECQCCLGQKNDVQQSVNVFNVYEWQTGANNSFIIFHLVFFFCVFLFLFFGVLPVCVFCSLDKCIQECVYVCRHRCMRKVVTLFFCIPCIVSRSLSSVSIKNWIFTRGG